MLLAFHSGWSCWQSKVRAELQGRVFAVRRALEQGTIPVGLLLVGPLVDHVFEPAMRGRLGATPAPAFGLLTVSAGLVGFWLPCIRRLDPIYAGIDGTGREDLVGPALCWPQHQTLH